MGWEYTFRKSLAIRQIQKRESLKATKRFIHHQPHPPNPPQDTKKNTENRTIHRSLTHVVVGISDTNQAYGTRNEIPSIPYHHHHLSTFCLSTTKTIQKKREKI